MQLVALGLPVSEPSPHHTVWVGGRAVPIEYRRHHRARRYVLRLHPDGTARVSLPPRGSLRAAQDFAERQTGWLARQLARLESRPAPDRCWRDGSTFRFRGQPVRLQVVEDASGCRATFADQELPVPHHLTDLRNAIEAHLRRLATEELPPRVLALAAQAGLVVKRVTIRDQRSRWGSCSRHGAISLNWRLVQMPETVRDYVIWHELMHRRELNHSARFWRQVAAVCPDFEQARRWLHRHGEELR
ncbi:MAG: M48 family metallopeptidase [Verrucomicrobiales bacterium]|nr:M48 family metallopeptidase [Verrucomicrobiales bacterium]